MPSNTPGGNKKEKSTPLGIMKGASVLRDSLSAVLDMQP